MNHASVLKFDLSERLHALESDLSDMAALLGVVSALPGVISGVDLQARQSLGLLAGEVRFAGEVCGLALDRQQGDPGRELSAYAARMVTSWSEAGQPLAVIDLVDCLAVRLGLILGLFDELDGVAGWLADKSAWIIAGDRLGYLAAAARELVELAKGVNA